MSARAGAETEKNLDSPSPPLRGFGERDAVTLFLVQANSTRREQVTAAYLLGGRCAVDFGLGFPVKLLLDHAARFYRLASCVHLL